MSLHYSLEYSSKSSDSTIKNVIDINLMNVFPSLICSEGLNHAGISANSSDAMGTFILKFIVVDAKQSNALDDLIKKACGNRTPEEFKLTCFTVAEDKEVAENYQAVFQSHGVYFSYMDSDAARIHIFMIAASRPRSLLVHTTFIKSTGTKMRMARFNEEDLMVDYRGHSIVQQ